MSESLDGTVHFAPVLLVLYSVSLVVLLLSFCKGDVHLCEPFLIDVDTDGYYCETRLVLCVRLKVSYFFFVQEQFAVALLFMVVVRT